MSTKTPQISEAARDAAANIPRVNRLISRDFVNQVDHVLVAVRNLIERSSPASISKIPGYTPFLLVAAHATQNTFNAVRYLLADNNDSDRKPEFCLAVSPNIRFLADLLSTIIVIRQRPRKYIKWYYRSGWRELKESLERLKNEPGVQRKLSRQIAAQTAALEHLRKSYGISRALAKAHEDIDYWPYLGQFLKNKKHKLRPRRFLSYLNTWFYSELSQDAHISSAGLIRMYSKLLLEKTDTDREKILKLIKTNNFMLCLILAIAIASELNEIGQFDRGAKLSYIWRILITDWLDARRIYKLRYRAMAKRVSNYS
jgi:hypothetical protein